MIMMPVNDRHVVVIHKGGGGGEQIDYLHIKHTWQTRRGVSVSPNLQSFTK